MDYTYLWDRLKRSWTKLIIIAIVICYTIVLVLNHSSLSQSLRTEFMTRASEGPQSPMTYYLRDGIHVSLICAKHQFNQMAMVAIKSIMFHRRKSYNLTFHIFTDLPGEKLFKNYFIAAANICTKFRLYPIGPLLEMGQKFLKKHQITNEHYSGIYSVSKAFVHDILPLDVNHVLLIDTDVIFVDDVYSIWEEFQSFKKHKTALGLAPWNPPLPLDYKYKGSDPDPFLTGVVLLDLIVCRSIGFTRLLDEITATAYIQFQLRTLWTADQVLLSLFATYYPQYFVTLPCYVNAHTFHYLPTASTWKSSCPEEHLRNIHVVPSSNFFKKDHYFRHLYKLFEDMPIEWLSHCTRGESWMERRANKLNNTISNRTKS